MSLVAYHLPLDAHPELGNTRDSCAGCWGSSEPSRSGWHVAGRPGSSAGRRRVVAADELVERCRAATDRDPLVVGRGPEVVRSAGIVTGAGASMLDEAVELGLDAFVTGEPAERVVADAREASMHFVAAGHYATETFGIRRLGEVIASLRHRSPLHRRCPNPIRAATTPAWPFVRNLQDPGFDPSGASGKVVIPHRREEERGLMAIHLTPTELAREAGMHRREVITKCMEPRVPIFRREGSTSAVPGLAARGAAQEPAREGLTQFDGSTRALSVARDVESRRRPRAGAGR